MSGGSAIRNVVGALTGADLRHRHLGNEWVAFVRVRTDDGGEGGQSLPTTPTSPRGCCTGRSLRI